MKENENPNSYNYNPNRPYAHPQNVSQNNANGPEERKDDHSDAKKVVDTAAKGAAEYFAPGVGGMAYDAAKKVPVVGDTIDKTTDKVAKVADKVPGVKQVTKGLNDSGVTDIAGSAVDLVSSKGASSLNQASKGAESVGKKAVNTARPNDIGKQSKTTEQIERPLRKNTIFSNWQNAQVEFSDDDESGNDIANNNNSLASNSSNDNGNNLANRDDNKSDDKTKNSGENDILAKGLKSLWKKHGLLIILSGGGIAFFLIIFIVIIAGGSMESEMSEMAYYDTMCNFNDTKVTITDCYLNESEKVELATYDLGDLVVNMTYAYTKNGNYSDETLKALMIVLKTNALSYGEYNSSDKNIEVRVCDLLSNNSNDLEVLEGVDNKKNNLDNLYNEISNYLYISSSYQSSISNMSRQNVLSLDANLIGEFEKLASEGNDYTQILNAIYNTNNNPNDLSTPLRENLFLGDSRTKGMQNTGVINNSNTIYGIGYGYSWLVGSGSFNSTYTNATNGGINGISNLFKDNTSYNIIIWLGVNDLGNVNAYYEKYYELAKDIWSEHNIYIVSVGPVEDAVSAFAKNKTINDFNSTMQNLINSSGLSNLFYIDLGYTEESIKEYDSEGIHYSSEDYKAIYNIIVSNLDNKLSGNYQLYNLTNYCTHYTLTENEAYWWPVGSSNATKGNIYGGEPTSKVITSKFGRRNTGIAGASTNHKGIDIAKNGSSCGDVIVASRSGTVITATDQGGLRGTYVKIDHGDGVVTLYQHMIKGSYTVSVGDKVEQGQKIGLIGNTGVGSGCHLHFEVIVNGVQVDPLDYVDPLNPRPVSTSTLLGGDITIVGDNGNYDDYQYNKNVVCKSLLASGFSTNAVVGIMTNMEVESASTYNPEIVEYGSGYNINTIYNAPSSAAAGFGLIQWSFGRRIQLIEYAKERNWEAASMQAQLNYLYYEIANISAYSVTNKYITGNYAGYDIAVAFCKNFERPVGSTTNLNVSDSCTARALNGASKMTTYVENGCS